MFTLSRSHRADAASDESQSREILFYMQTAASTSCRGYLVRSMEMLLLGWCAAGGMGAVGVGGGAERWNNEETAIVCLFSEDKRNLSVSCFFILCMYLQKKLHACVNC